MNSSMMMADAFSFSKDIQHFLLESINISAAKGLVAACAVMAALAILIEVGRLLQSYITKSADMNPLTYAHTEKNISERSPLVTPMLIPASIRQINKRWLKYHSLQTLLHVGQVVLGYIVMLAVMTYNAWIFISVIIASGIGYFIFAAIQDHIVESESTANHHATNTANVDITDELLGDGAESMMHPVTRESPTAVQRDGYGSVTT